MFVAAPAFSAPKGFFRFSDSPFRILKVPPPENLKSCSHGIFSRTERLQRRSGFPERGLIESENMSPYLGFYGMDRISGFVEVVSENLKSANWTYILWDGLKLRSFDDGITS